MKVRAKVGGKAHWGSLLTNRAVILSVVAVVMMIGMQIEVTGMLMSRSQHANTMAASFAVNSGTNNSGLSIQRAQPPVVPLLTTQASAGSNVGGGDGGGGGVSNVGVVAAGSPSVAASVAGAQSPSAIPPAPPLNLPQLPMVPPAPPLPPVAPAPVHAVDDGGGGGGGGTWGWSTIANALRGAGAAFVGSTSASESMRTAGEEVMLDDDGAGETTRTYHDDNGGSGDSAAGAGDGFGHEQWIEQIEKETSNQRQNDEQPPPKEAKLRAATGGASGGRVDEHRSRRIRNKYGFNKPLPRALSEVNNGEYPREAVPLMEKRYETSKGFKECDTSRSEAAWELNEGRWSRPATICEGVSTITCVLDAPHGIPVRARRAVDRGPGPGGPDPVVRFCVMHNIKSPASPPIYKDPAGAVHSEDGEGRYVDGWECSGNRGDGREIDNCAWQAYCKPTGYWADQRGDLMAGLFRGYGRIPGRHHFARRTINIEQNESKWPSRDNWPNSSAPAPPPLPFPVADSDPSSVEGPERKHTPPFTPEHPVHYISNGDCGGRWNPGHCHADLLSAELVLRMLGASRESTRVVLQAGHNNAPSEEFRHGPFPWDKIDRWPVFAAWHAVGGAGVLTRSELANQTYSREVGLESNSYVSYAAISPPSFTSTWWAHESCRGARVSPIMASFKARITRYLDAAASQAWLEHGTRVLNESTMNVQKVEPSWGSVPLSDERFDGLILYTARRANVGAGQTHPRWVHNRIELFEAVKRNFPGRPLLMIELGSKVPYLVQYALWRRAELIMGIHGGNLGMSLYLSPGQSLVELGFDVNQMSQYGHVTIGNGAFYRGVNVHKDPNMDGNEADDLMKVGGVVDIPETIACLQEVLQHTGGDAWKEWLSFNTSSAIGTKCTANNVHGTGPWGSQFVVRG